METKLLSLDRPVSIYYAFITDVESISSEDANTMAVIFKAGKGWKAINTTIGTIDLQENTGNERPGVIYNNNLTATCPGHEEKTPCDIAGVSGRKALIRLDYKSGMKKLIGNMDAAPRLYIKTSSGTTTSRKLQSDFKSAHPNYWLL